MSFSRPMTIITGQAIIAELAVEYNTAVDYIEGLPHRCPQQLAGAHMPDPFSADRSTAMGQLAGLRTAMQIVARQAHVKLILPK